MGLNKFIEDEFQDLPKKKGMLKVNLDLSFGTDLEIPDLEDKFAIPKSKIKKIVKPKEVDLKPTKKKNKSNSLI
jgi:hypothetical protein